MCPEQLPRASRLAEFFRTASTGGAPRSRHIRLFKRRPLLVLPFCLACGAQDANDGGPSAGGKSASQAGAAPIMAVAGSGGNSSVASGGSGVGGAVTGGAPAVGGAGPGPSTGGSSFIPGGGSGGAPALAPLDCGTEGWAVENHGNPKNRINYLILGDGYTATP